ncbi:hypothetical protein EVAR_20135_1 [Eumeta japonica]|uniref:Reverse transcriptase domain-containing protein n=1 Tax=Eumeta variegata TaxID=151549 RepID=A0A4C1V3Z6_EUMVA|nr:hypothetical protein EVAR_20135_1 [Eumeta japonica]
MLAEYFTDWRMEVHKVKNTFRKWPRMGCPQDSILRLTLKNILLDVLSRLPFPDGVQTVAHTDDITVLVEAELYRYFPGVLKYQTSQLLTGHGYFCKRLFELRPYEERVCDCNMVDDNMHHVLWEWSLYDRLCKVMFEGLEVLHVSPVTTWTWWTHG